MNHEYHFGKGKVSLGFKIFMILWFLGIGYLLFSTYKEGSGMIEFLGIVILLIMTVTFISIVFAIKRTNIYMYRDYFTVQRPLRSTDVNYNEVGRLKYVALWNGERQSYFFYFYNTENKPMFRVGARTLGNEERQREFVEILRSYNKRMVLDDSVKYFLGELESDDFKLVHDFGDLAERLSQVDNKTIVRYLLWFFAGFTFLFFIIPVIITLVALWLEG